MNQEKIGKYIQERRKEKKLTQKQLADKLRISEKTISKWECGNGLPEVSLMQPLCDELDITVTELLNGKDKKEQNVIKYIQHENKKSKRKTIITSIIFMLLITAFLFTGIYFLNSYNKIVFYKLYGQSENFAYSDGLITKSNINNIYSFGKIVLENTEIEESDIYYIEVKCGEITVFGAGTQHFYASNGMLLIEENGYNEILSPYKLENLDDWKIEIEYNDKGKRRIEVIEIRQEEIMSNNKFFSFKTQSIDEKSKNYETEETFINNKIKTGKDNQTKYYNLFKLDGYVKEGNYLLIKKISEQEEITINCKDNTLSYYNANNSKNMYTIVGSLEKNVEREFYIDRINIIGYANNKSYTVTMRNEETIPIYEYPNIDLEKMVKEYSNIRNKVENIIYEEKA